MLEEQEKRLSEGRGRKKPATRARVAVVSNDSSKSLVGTANLEFFMMDIRPKGIGSALFNVTYGKGALKIAPSPEKFSYRNLELLKWVTFR
jgi:hypothetical protein